MHSTSALPKPHAVLDVDHGGIFKPLTKRGKKTKTEKKGGKKKKVLLFVLAACLLGRRVRGGTAGEARPAPEGAGGSGAALLGSGKGLGTADLD